MFKPEQRIVVYDFETTGFVATKDQPIEICAKSIELDGSTKLFHCLVAKSPQFTDVFDKPLPEKITEITGITDQMLIDSGIRYEDAMSDFFDFLDLHSGTQPYLVGHNAVKFDIQFLTEGNRRMNRKPLPVIAGWDTAGYYKAKGLNIRRDTNETILRWHLRALNAYAKGFFFKLTLCCENAGIKNQGAHRADADVEMTFQLFLHQYGEYTSQNLLTQYLNQQNEKTTDQQDGSANDSNDHAAPQDDQKGIAAEVAEVKREDVQADA